jgi:hypothetical protein
MLHACYIRPFLRYIGTPFHQWFLISSNPARERVTARGPLITFTVQPGFRAATSKVTGRSNLSGAAIRAPLRAPTGKNVGNNALYPDAKPLQLLAYADDLLIFLSKPTEWQQLNVVLEIYHKASNAKVNLEKTNMSSMAGNALPQWQAMVTDFRGKWHDYNSQASLVYLGYPIYHNAYQLNGFLTRK